MTEGEVDLKHCFQIIHHRKIFIIGGMLLFMVIAAIIVSIVSPVYQITTMLKIGRIYLPPNSISSDSQLLEPVKLLAGVIDSGAPLKNAEQKLRGGTAHTGNMEAETFYKEDFPLIEIRCYNREPQFGFELLTEVVKTIIERHNRKYESNQKALSTLVDNLRKKIKTNEATIAAQTQHLQEIHKISNEGQEEVGVFKDDLEQLDSSTISPIELLFLQSSSLNEGTFFAQMNQVKADLQVSIEANYEKIATFQDSIVKMENRIALSLPTEIIIQPVLPEDPISPKKTLIVVIAGFMGLVFATLYVFLREYVKD